MEQVQGIVTVVDDLNPSRRDDCQAKQIACRLAISVVMATWSHWAKITVVTDHHRLKPGYTAAKSMLVVWVAAGASDRRACDCSIPVSAGRLSRRRDRNDTE